MQISISLKLGGRSKTSTDAHHILVHLASRCFMMFLVPTPFSMLPLSSGHGIADSGGPALKVLPDQLVSRLHSCFSLKNCELWHWRLRKMRN